MKPLASSRGLVARMCGWARGARVMRPPGLFLCALLISGPSLPGIAEAVPPGWQLTFDAGGTLGGVTFSGQLHWDSGMMCLDCHMEPFRIRRRGPEGRLGMGARHEPGRLCGKCHDGRRAFDVSEPGMCARCHAGPGAGVEARDRLPATD